MGAERYVHRDVGIMICKDVEESAAQKLKLRCERTTHERNQGGGVNIKQEFAFPQQMGCNS